MNKGLLRACAAGTAALLATGTFQAAAAPSRRAARRAAVYPILAVGEHFPDSGMLLGGVRGGKWVEQGKLAPSLRGGEKYRFYSLSGPVGTRTGGKPAGGEPLPEQMFVPMKPALKIGADAVGLTGGWNPMPRPVRAQSTRQQVYVDALAAFLRSKGLQNPRLNLTQVLRVDLEGDGNEEVLLSAVTPDYDVAEARKDDYTVILLRKLVGGEVRTHLLDGRFFPTAGGQMTGGNRVSIAGVLDLNGDGVLEIVTEYVGYEENGYEVFTVKGTRAARVLTAGIGV